jgi:hypothetical protein
LEPPFIFACEVETVEKTLLKVFFCWKSCEDELFFLSLHPQGHRLYDILVYDNDTQDRY